MLSLPKNQCTGCAACVDTCTRGAISLVEDENGYLYPKVEEQICTHCGLCDKKCHSLHSEEIKKNEVSKHPFAAWSIESEVIENSASGGVFTQVAKEFLAQGGDIVYGAMLSEDMQVRHIGVTRVEELRYLQNSKFQQCNATGIYSDVKKRLAEGKQVLFSGTPCMIGALYRFLGDDKILREKLYTAEILCHGVPSNELFRMGLKIEGAERIVKYRTKSQGWLKGNRVVYQGKDGHIYEKGNRRTDFVFRSYLTSSVTRPNCFECQYASMKRVADITMGDFWGLDRKKYMNYKGVSLLLVNNEKGRTLVDNTKNLSLKATTWKECMPFNQNLFMATNKRVFDLSLKVAKLRDKPFWIRKMLYQNGFTNKYLDLLYQMVYRILSFPKRNRIKKEIRDEENRNYNDILCN